MTDPQPSTTEPMVLTLIEAKNGKRRGNVNVAVEIRLDGSATVIGSVRLVVLGWVKDAAFRLDYSWADEDADPTFLFRVPGIRELDPDHVLEINSIEISKDPAWVAE